MSLLLAFQQVNALVLAVGVFASGLVGDVTIAGSGAAAPTGVYATGEVGSVAIFGADPVAPTQILNGGLAGKGWGYKLRTQGSASISGVGVVSISVSNGPLVVPYTAPVSYEFSTVAAVGGSWSTGRVGKIVPRISNSALVLGQTACGTVGVAKVRKISNPSEQEVVDIMRIFWGLND